MKLKLKGVVPVQLYYFSLKIDVMQQMQEIAEQLCQGTYNLTTETKEKKYTVSRETTSQMMKRNTRESQKQVGKSISNDIVN